MMQIFSTPLVFLALCMLIFVPVASFAQEAGQGPVTDSGRLSDNLSSYYESGSYSTDQVDANSDEISFSAAIRLALEQNLNLQAATFDARAKELIYQGAFGLYDPLVTMLYREGERRDLLNIAAPNDFDLDYQETTIALSQKLPLGTELTLSGQLFEQEETPPQALNPVYDSYARLSLVQPLLRGFGLTATEKGIIFSAKDRQIARQDLRTMAFQVVADVRNAYYDALQAQYALSYRESSAALARRIVQENTARVDAGILAPVEKLEAEVGLQSRERLLLDAQRAFADSLDRLNLLLNARDKYYHPVIQPFTMDFEVDEDDGVSSGILKRPDVIRRTRQIEKNRAEQSLARNSLLPELNVVAAYSQNGLSDNKSNSIDMVKEGDYDSWEVGVEFSYPLFNIESRNELKRADVELKQQRALLAQLHNEVRNEVRAAIRRIDVNRKKTEVAKKGHDLATEKLRILLKSREVGLATTRDVLDGGEDLASARNDQITSVSDFFKSITEYLRATGTLLESENIVFSGDEYSSDNQSLFHVVP